MYKSFTVTLIFLIVSKLLCSQQTHKFDSNIRDSSFLFSNCLSEDDSKSIFKKMEVDAYFPGGYKGWYNFLKKNLDLDSIKANINSNINNFRDTIIFKFIVSKEGNICGLSFLNSKPSILINSVIKLLLKSPNWIPATNGSRALNSYRTLKIEVCYSKEDGKFYIPKDIEAYNLTNE